MHVFMSSPEMGILWREVLLELWSPAHETTEGEAIVWKSTITEIGKDAFCYKNYSGLFVLLGLYPVKKLSLFGMFWSYLSYILFNHTKQFDD